MYVEADVNPDAERIMTMEDDEPSEPVAEPSDPFAAAAAEHEEIPLLENEMDDLGDLPLAGQVDDAIIDLEIFGNLITEKLSTIKARLDNAMARKVQLESEMVQEKRARLDECRGLRAQSIGVMSSNQTVASGEGEVK